MMSIVTDDTNNSDYNTTTTTTNYKKKSDNFVNNNIKTFTIEFSLLLHTYSQRDSGGTRPQTTQFKL